jgi:hypothetical protein
MRTTTTREEVALRIREGKPLTGLRFRSVRGERVRREANKEEIERVRAELGDAAAEARVVPMIWSTERRADDSHSIKTNGWRLDRHRKSPVVLWRHQSWMPRIGDAVAYVDQDEHQLRALVAFLPRDLNELSWSLGEIAATRGYASSVGWETLRAVPAPDEVRRQLPWALDILEAELLEGSLVNIPSDEDALAGGRAAGVDVEPIARALERAIDEAIGRSDRDALERMWRAAASPSRPVVVDTKPAAITAAQVAAAARAALGGQLPDA